MKYEGMIVSGSFLERPNRFLAWVMLDGEKQLCHVKNTGRCRELLVPGAIVYMQKNNNPARKTKYSLIGVKKGEQLVNIDSQAPNKVVGEWLLSREAEQYFGRISRVRPESTFGNSRFDFYIETQEGQAYVEVKGVTLEEESVARFPDAPTERGVKHIRELCECVKSGYAAYIIFLIQLEKAVSFEPNDKTHKAFGDALRKAEKEGVHILAFCCDVQQDTLNLMGEIPVHL